MDLKSWHFGDARPSYHAITIPEIWSCLPGLCVFSGKTMRHSSKWLLKKHHVVTDGWWHISLTERAKSRWIESASGMCLPGWLSMLGPFRISSAKHQGKQSIGLGGARESSWETNKSVDLKARLYQLMLQLTLFYTHSLCKSHIAFAI